MADIDFVVGCYNNNGGGTDNAQVVYVDSFHINSDLVDSNTLKQMVHRLASLDIYNKHKQNAPKIQSLHVVVGTETTVQYTFTAGAEYQELNRQYQEQTPRITLPTEQFTNEIMDSKKDQSEFIDARKLAMTFRDPVTGSIYFQTHTGKVYDNHYAFGEVPVKPKHEGYFVTLDCDHEFKTVEQPTRSGDEEITVTKICVKCNADHRNLKTLPKIAKESDIKKAADHIHRIVEGAFDYEEALTIARIIGSLHE